MDNTNLLGFKSHYSKSLALEVRDTIIDGVSGYDIIKKECGCELTSAQRAFRKGIEDRTWPVEQGRRRILELLGLGHCLPGYDLYEVSDFDWVRDSTIKIPADPTEWVEDWVANLCPDEEWWNHHRKSVTLGLNTRWSFGTPEDYLHFQPGQFDLYWDEKFPFQLPSFTRVKDNWVSHRVVVPFIKSSFRAGTAYGVETPRF